MSKITVFGILLLAAVSVQGADLQVGVSDITADYGNINTDVSADQLTELGIEPGDRFVVTFGDHQVTAFY